MRERGWGRCIQISSRNAIAAYAEFGPYGAAKAAINNLTLSLSKALAGTGGTSNGIMPGLVYTPLVDHWFEVLAKQQGSGDPAVGRDPRSGTSCARRSAGSASQKTSPSRVA